MYSCKCVYFIMVVSLFCTAFAFSIRISAPHGVNLFGDIPVSNNEFAQRMDSESRKRLETLVVDYMAMTQVTAASIAVARDGQVLYANGFGRASVEDNENAAIRHKFRVASVSKTVCLVTILKLIETGRLSLDDFVFSEKLLGKMLYRNFTDVTERLAKVTVRQLLHHSGGFWMGYIQEYPEMSNIEYLNWALVANGSLQQEPGTVHIYSDFGFFLLGRVVEVVTSTPYVEFVYEHVFGPMGVKGAFIAGPHREDRQTDEVVYYSRVPPPTLPYTCAPNMRRWDALGAWAFVPLDLLHFLNTLETFLSPASRALMLTPNPIFPRRGLCWMVESRTPGEIEYFHRGWMPGTGAHVQRFEAEGHVYTYALAMSDEFQYNQTHYVDTLWLPIRTLLREAKFVEQSASGVGINLYI